MAITIYSDKIVIGDYTLLETPTGFSIDGNLDANSFGITASTAYTLGGTTGTPVNTINSFPFSTPFTIATDSGDLSQAKSIAAGAYSSTNGYSAGGFTPTAINTIDNFPFSTPFITATDIGDLSVVRANAGGGNSSSLHGYVSGGQSNPSFLYLNSTDRYPFSTPFATATPVINLSSNRIAHAAHSSSTDGYVSGGNNPPVGRLNSIEKFPFSSPYTITDIGDLTSTIQATSGHSSPDSGYTAGGNSGSPTNIIQSFPFSTPFTTATDIGDLVISREYPGGNSSATDGYNSGGRTPPIPAYYNIIDKFPFTTPFVTAVDIGDITVSVGGIVGVQG
jgi:hypothetical protein